MGRLTPLPPPPQVQRRPKKPSLNRVKIRLTTMVYKTYRIKRSSMTRCTFIQLLKVISLEAFGRDNKLVNGLELVRICVNGTRFSRNFYLELWNGKNREPFLNLRSFRKISNGNNQNGALHIHSKRNFRKFCVNGKQPDSVITGLPDIFQHILPGKGEGGGGAPMRT